MNPYLDDGDVQLYVGDARVVLADLPERSVHAVLTSPPFYGLRDYQTGTWEGGDPACSHEKPTTTMNAGFNERWGQGGGEKRQERKSGGQYAGECPKCGAVRVDHQIGLEATPDEWAASLVEVFAACRRVLRDDGSLWVECGDSYATKPGKGTNVPQTKHLKRDYPESAPHRSVEIPGVKPKDIIGAPYLLAFALRADGWFWRGAYVWEKPDAMPESVRDRCTTSHSMVLHFAKSARYFFDRDAIREPFSDYSTGGDGGSYGANADRDRVWEGGKRGSQRYVRNRGGVPDGQVTLDGQEPEQEIVGPDGRTALHVEAQANSEQHRDGDRWPSLEGRSPRSVWRITTEANSFGLCPACRRFWPEKAPARHCGVDVVAHFAVWPHKLVERIVSCSTSEAGACGDCGAPRTRRVKEGESRISGEGWHDHSDDARQGMAQVKKGQADWDTYEQPTMLGWEPTCECAAPTVPATVLDPFGGSGTTARQARAMGRYCVLVELSPDYAEIASHRLSQLALPLAVEA